LIRFRKTYLTAEEVLHVSKIVPVYFTDFVRCGGQRPRRGDLPAG